MFIYQPTAPQNTTFAPNFDSEAADESEATALWNATRDLQIFRDNANAEDSALGEAYARRNRAIFEATGVQLSNPMLDFSAEDLQEASRTLDAGGNPMAVSDRLEREWLAKVRQLAADRPEHAGVIAAARPITEDAFAITRQAEADFAKADQAELPTGRRVLNILGGGVAGILRDPLQIGTLFAGGGISAPGRFAATRIFSKIFTEAAINGGVEAAVQTAAQDYKRRAGVQHGLGDALQQVGIAAAFGGGFGGLLAGATEVLRLTGKSVPLEILQRAAMGTPEPGDIEAIGKSLGLEIDPHTARVADLAGEQRVLDRAAFGDPPAEIPEAAAEQLAARAVRDIEEPADRLPDAQQRFEAIDRITRSQQPLGPAPKKPVTLMQFLSSRAIGGLRDDGGELAAAGLDKKFVPGGGALVRKNGKQLDMAREAAAEAGYFDDLYGAPDRAVAESTVDDLLRLLRQEAGGEPVFSPRNDGGRQFEWLDFEKRQKAQDAYRNLVGRIDTAAQSIGLDKIDDAIIVRAAELVDDETDELDALERALDEDYRNYADAYQETGSEPFDDQDIPFFEDAGAGAPAGRADGEAGGDGGSARRGTDEADRPQLSRPGDDQGSQGLRSGGPEPGTPEAGETAALALTEAAGGVEPDKSDLWDVMPSGTKADGTASHVTHAELVEDAERDETFAALISSCKD